MEERKLKLIEYLQKNLAVAEGELVEIGKVADEIATKKAELAELEKRAEELGCAEKAEQAVVEIKGYIAMFNEPIAEDETSACETIVVDETALVEPVAEPVVG